MTIEESLGKLAGIIRADEQRYRAYEQEIKSHCYADAGLDDLLAVLETSEPARSELPDEQFGKAWRFIVGLSFQGEYAKHREMYFGVTKYIVDVTESRKLRRKRK